MTVPPGVREALQGAVRAAVIELVVEGYLERAGENWSVDDLPALIEQARTGLGVK